MKMKVALPAAVMAVVAATSASTEASAHWRERDWGNSIAGVGPLCGQGYCPLQACPPRLSRLLYSTHRSRRARSISVRG